MYLCENIASVKWREAFLIILYCAVVWMWACLPEQRSSYAQESNGTGDQVKIAILCEGLNCKAQKEQPDEEKYQACTWVMVCQPAARLKRYGGDVIADPIALFTLFLVAVTAALAWYTASLYKATVKLANDGEISGANQTDIMQKQTDILEAQKTIQRLQYFATHRPKITVSRIELTLLENEKVAFNIAMTNSGGAAIRKLTFNFGAVLFPKGRGIEGIYDFSKHKIGERDFGDKGLEIGVFTDGANDTDFTPTKAQIKEIQLGVSVLHIIGIVLYTDMIGITRATGFFRAYNPQRRRFGHVNDAEYEYQD